MQKDSIKREQSQAGLSFAERKNRRSLAGGESNFRPQVKNKLLLLLALLMTAATGAWATDGVKLTTVELVPTAAWNGNENDLALSDMPGLTADGITEEQAKAWADVPKSGTVELIYGYVDNGTKMNFKIITFTDGVFISSLTLERSYDAVYYYLNTANTKTYYATGAVAATTYTVSMKDGVKDADKWTITPNPAEEGQTVTLQYNGRLKVKGVKATSDAAAPSVPDGAISGVFSVSATKQVYFSKGNLRYESGAWSFFDNQYDYYTGYSADAWDKFGWSTSATTYGMNTSTTDSNYSGDFVDWGATMGTGWFTLSKDEWTYLINTRTVNSGTGDGKSYTKGQSVNGTLGVVFYPDNYTGEVYSGSDWATFESAGCVFLPAAGLRGGSSVYNPGTDGDYWSATPNGTDEVYCVYFASDNLDPASSFTRNSGCNVRLVREVATSDAPAAKEPATVTTAPTGAAVVGVGKTTALVSGGVADGGTLMYAVTTTNTKPTSTDGFSATVPTAKTITASGKVYVWYYVKADDTHTDSEIAATAIEVPVADIVWDITNVSDLMIFGTDEYEKEGVKLSVNADQIQAFCYNYGNPEWDGISFETMESGGYTFTAPTGKAFTKIEMKAVGPNGWGDASEFEKLGTGWAFDWDYAIATWKGSAAASTVDLLTDESNFHGENITYIAFTLVDAE